MWCELMCSYYYLHILYIYVVICGTKNKIKWTNGAFQDERILSWDRTHKNPLSYIRTL